MFKGYDSLKQVLDLLAKEIDVLPASGGTLEDLERPDVDEIGDVLVNADTKVDVVQFGARPARRRRAEIGFLTGGTACFPPNKIWRRSSRGRSGSHPRTASG
jgi:hypothetical protein